MLEEQPRDPVGGEREEGAGQVVQGLVGCGPECGLLPGAGGSLESGAHRRPLAAVGGTDYYIELRHHPSLQMRKLRLKKVSHLSRVTGARGLSGAGMNPWAQASLRAVFLGPRPSPELSVPLCISLLLGLCHCAYLVCLSLCLSIFVSSQVSDPGTSGPPAGWYLYADDDGPAHGQQLVVDSEDTVEDWPWWERKGPPSEALPLPMPPALALSSHSPAP